MNQRVSEKFQGLFCGLRLFTRDFLKITTEQSSFLVFNCKINYFFRGIIKGKDCFFEFECGVCGSSFRHSTDYEK